MAAAARPHTKLGQRDFRKIYPNVWQRDYFYGVIYPPGPPAYEQSKDAQRFGTLQARRRPDVNLVVVAVVATTTPTTTRCSSNFSKACGFTWV
jgi:hypothetical protein